MFAALAGVAARRSADGHMIRINIGAAH